MANKPSISARASRVVILTALILALMWAFAPTVHDASPRAKASRVRYDFQEFEKLLTEDIDSSSSTQMSMRDPFQSGGSYNISGNGEEVLIYSFGPDAMDDRAHIAYDATNGAKSSGDIFKRIKLSRGAAAESTATVGTTSTL